MGQCDKRALGEEMGEAPQKACSKTKARLKSREKQIGLLLYRQSEDQTGEKISAWSCPCYSGSTYSSHLLTNKPNA